MDGRMTAKQCSSSPAFLGLNTQIRQPYDTSADCTDENFAPLVKLWFTLAEGRSGLPSFDRFDVTDLPGRCWPSLLLAKLIGTPRRFFYVLAGNEIASHYPDPIGKRFLKDLPIANRRVVAKEFAHALRFGRPVFSEGPFLGKSQFIETVRRVICPFDLGNDQFAFLCIVLFMGYDRRPVPIRRIGRF